MTIRFLFTRLTAVTYVPTVIRCGDMDIEDELSLFCLRKESNLYSGDEKQFSTKYKQSTNVKGNVHNYIPLMVKHIKTLNGDSWDLNSNIKIFNEKIIFKHCLIYGKIISKGKETDHTYTYTLDDGTGCVDIKIFRRPKELKTVWKLETELEGVKRDMLAQNKNEIVKSLRNLLLQTKKQMDHSSIPVGSKVLIYGKPSFYHGQVSMDIYHVVQDGNRNRDTEITFKDQLIDWYTKNVLVDS